jgi:hypothetical protein
MAMPPRELAVLLPVSMGLLPDAETNPDLDAVLRDDLSDVVAFTQELGLVDAGGAAPTRIVTISRQPRPKCGWMLHIHTLKHLQ